MVETLPSIYQATFTFSIAAIALLASPGPATLALAASGAAYGLKRSILFFAGITAGLVIALALVTAGLDAFIHSFPYLGTTLTAVSILYILYLAYAIATTPPVNDGQTATNPGLTAGFILGIANIKAYAAFAALLSSFTVGVTPTWESFTKASICLAVCVVFDCLWLLVGSKLRKLFVHRTWSRVLNVSFAVLMVVTIAWSFLLTG